MPFPPRKRLGAIPRHSLHDSSTPPSPIHPVIVPSPSPLNASSSRNMASGTASAAVLTALEPNLGVDMVIVYVGPKRKEFIIHKKLICQAADYFDKAFNGIFKEGQEGIMYMLDENPGAFSLFVNWLYRSALPTGHTESHLNDLIDLYILGEKICNTELKEKTMDSIQDIALRYKLSEPFIKAEVVKKVFENVSRYRGMQSFLINIMVHTYNEKTASGAFKACSSENLEKLWEMSKSNFEILKNFHGLSAILLEQSAKAGYVYWDPRDRKEEFFSLRCCFHCHESTVDCRADRAENNEPKFIRDISSAENSS